MKFDSNYFRVREGDKVDLGKWPTKVDPLYKSKEHFEEMLAERIAKLSSLQQLLYASNRYALLLIFQGMDAAGKDSAIKHVMSGVNPQAARYSASNTRNRPNCNMTSSGAPRCIFPSGAGSASSTARTSKRFSLPVCIRRSCAAKASRARNVTGRRSGRNRYRSIVDLETHLHRNGTRIVKYFLHLSKEEQRKRFLERIDDPEKNWKFSSTDIEERKFWKDYMKAYEKCLGETSTSDAPWYVIPADDKQNARLIISRIVVETLEGLEMTFPRADKEHRDELLTLRKQLVK
jgi:polyphosphate kinase 2 (PPK2 family)